MAEKELKCVACGFGISSIGLHLDVANSMVREEDFDTAKSILKGLDAGLMARLRKTGIQGLRVVCGVDIREVEEKLKVAIKAVDQKRKEDAIKAIHSLADSLEDVWKKSECTI